MVVDFALFATFSVFVIAVTNVGDIVIMSKSLEIRKSYFSPQNDS